MGTTWSARVAAPATLDRAALYAAITAELDAVIAAMSHWEARSQISRFNRAPANSWHTLSPAFFHVLDAGLALARESNGAFDPTAGALVNLWGFGPAPAPPGLPTRDAISAARSATGWASVKLDRHARRACQPGGVQLDLSGIAKGHAVDRVAACILARGHRHALVEVGGEYRGMGMKPDGQPWWVAIEPPPGMALPETRIALYGLSVATSGDYRRWFDQGGRRYAHSLDPRSGWPVDNGVASVTVVHADCMMADALATALLVMGPEEAVPFATAREIAALIVKRSDAAVVEHVTPAFAAMLR